jgi:hypothetical protein
LVYRRHGAPPDKAENAIFATAARRFFRRAIATLKVKPTEVVTDAAAVYPAVIEDLIPLA